MASFNDICFAICGKTKPTFLKQSINEKPVGAQKQYFAEETVDFINEMGEYATNPYVVEVQEIGSTEWVKHYARLTDVLEPKTGQTRGDTWKTVIFYGETPKVTLGMKLRFENNIWLGYNSNNSPTITESIIVRQCGNVLNWLDEWGNVICEPCVLNTYGILDPDNMTNPSLPAALPKGDKEIFVQNNPFTAQIENNDRFIIGGSAWKVYGIDRTQRQETYNKNSNYLVSFHITKDESVVTDDMENEVANGKSVIWEVKTNFNTINGKAGDTGTLNAKMYLNGQLKNSLSVRFASSDSGVVEVDEKTGEYQLIGEGNASILCAFDKNNNVTATVPIKVEPTTLLDEYAIVAEPIIESLKQYEKVDITAHLYKNGQVELNMPVNFVFSEAPIDAYSVSNIMDNSFTLSCIKSHESGSLQVSISASAAGQDYNYVMAVMLTGIWGR